MIPRDDFAASAGPAGHPDFAVVWSVINERRAARQARHGVSKLWVPSIERHEVKQLAADQDEWRVQYRLFTLPAQATAPWSPLQGRAMPAERMLLPALRW